MRLASRGLRLQLNKSSPDCQYFVFSFWTFTGGLHYAGAGRGHRTVKLESEPVKIAHKG